MKRTLLCLLAVLLAIPAHAKITRYLTGNPADVVVPLAGPAHDFGGGGTDVDAALQWIIDTVRGCTSCSTKIDVVVLRSSGADGYNDYIYAMNGVDSVETLVITTAADANTTDVETTVKNAEVVFFAGGDQCDYVTYFKGTKVETAVQSVYAKGGGVGGTSAGVAIQGDFIYDGCNNSAISSKALANPFDHTITFTYDFFHWANMQNTITDDHFVTRDRMGRTMAFLARQIHDGVTTSALAVAINEATSVEVDRNGHATVVGAGPAYFILADHAPETCLPKTPLTYSNYKIWKVNAGGTFNLANRPSNGYYLRSVNNGVIDQNPY